MEAFLGDTDLASNAGLEAIPAAMAQQMDRSVLSCGHVTGSHTYIIVVDAYICSIMGT